MIYKYRDKRKLAAMLRVWVLQLYLVYSFI